MPRKQARGRRGDALDRLPRDLRDRLAGDGLARLLRAARHELAVREGDGEIERGEVEAGELVDLALLDAVPALGRHRDDPRAGLLIVRRRLPVVLDRMIAARDRAAEREVSLQAEVRERGSSTRPSTEDDPEDVGVSHETLAVEDVLGERQTLEPEARTGEAEVRHRLVQALFGLVPDRRRLFEAVVLDGFTVATVAVTHDRSNADVTRTVEACLDELARALVDLGLGRAELRARYEALGEEIRDEHALPDAVTPGSG